MIPQSLRLISASMTAFEGETSRLVPEFSAAFIADSKQLL
jgi:hypothetical protein